MKVRRRPATPAEVERSLAQLRHLFQPLSRRQKAQRTFETAKLEYTSAAEALIAREPGAAERADLALVGLNAARAELARLEAEAANA